MYCIYYCLGICGVAAEGERARLVRTVSDTFVRNGFAVSYYVESVFAAHISSSVSDNSVMASLLTFNGGVFSRKR